MNEVVVTDEQVHAFMDLFRGYPFRFGRFVITGREESTGKNKGIARTEDRPPSAEDFRKHLEGKERLGIVPLREDNTASFCALDIDKYNDYPIEAFAKRVQSLPLICTNSKSGGIHAWMFMNPPKPAADVIKVMKHWAGELGHSNTEIFPKQSGRASKEDVGNWINLPYFGDTCRAVVWNNEGTEVRVLNLSEFLTIAKNTNPDLDFLLDGALKITSREKGSSPIDFADGPPCLQTILRKHAEGALDLMGTRNTTLFNVATYLKRKYDQPKAKAIVLSINAGTYTLTIDHSRGKEKRDPEHIQIPQLGMDDKEIESTLLRKTDKEYGYQCSQFPLNEYCQKQVCKKRKYGVGSDSRGDLEMTIENFVQYNSNPKKYFCDVDGKRVVFQSSEELMNQFKFKARILDVSLKVFPRMTDKQWEEFLQYHMARATVVDAPFEGSEVVYAMIQFIQERKARTVEDMDADDRVYYDDKHERYVCRPDAFKRYCEKTNQVKKYDSLAVREELERELDMDHGSKVQMRVGTKSGVRVWRIPYSAIERTKRVDREVEEESPF